MLKLIIEDDEGRKTVVPFVREEITIGRQEGNTIRLTERNVSRRHAKLVRHNGTVLVEDLGSYNGIRINGEKIQGQVPVNDGDLIQIGDYDLAVQHDQPAQVAPTQPLPAVHAADDIENTAPSADRKPNGNGAHAGAVHAAPFAEMKSEPALASASDVEEVRSDEVKPVVNPAAAEVARRQSTSIIHVDQIEGRPRQIVDIEPAEAPRLVLLNTDNAGREYACVRSELKIGRSDENDIGIDHRSLSRTHAKVVREDSGEWRVIDMQSANGLTVNGEHYAQATLNTGDVIELGHVKLKFVAAGESFAYSPDMAKGRPAQKGGGKGGVVAVLVILLAIGGGVGVWYKVFRGGPTPNPPDDGSNTVGEPSHPTTHTPDEAVNPPIPTGPTPEQIIAEAKQLIEDANWDQAKTKLQSAKLPDGRVHPEAEALQNKMRNEQEFKAQFDKAREALDADKPDEAAKLLAPVEAGSQLLRPAAKALRAEVNDAAKRKLEQKTEAAKNPPGNTGTPPGTKVADAKTPPVVTNPPAETKAASPAQEAGKYYQQGIDLAHAKQLHEARTVLEKCIKIDPTFALCHKALGGVNAKLNDPEKGLYHYKMFLKLAPNDKDADKVRNIVEAFEAQSKTAPH